VHAHRDRSTPARVIRPLRDFLALQAAGGILLVSAAVAALAWANSPWRGAYHAFWASHLDVRLAGHALALDLRHWVNDGLMTLFFFVVGLEIKRELEQGELKDRRRAALPAFGALGGMVVPALLYAALNRSGASAHGWGIPMATDIAMAIGVLALLGSRVHPSLTLFLLALAIVDDIGAIVVIALFYSSDIDGAMLMIAGLIVIAVVAAKRLGVHHVGVYTVLGGALWLATLEAGIHATIAGVVLGLLAPTKPIVIAELVDEAVLADISTFETAAETSRLARQSVSVVEWLENRLHPWTSYLIVPMFAFANAGIAIDLSSLRRASASSVTLGVVFGLVVGKAVGVSLASWLAVRSGVASLPEGVTWRDIVAASSLAGIGFTVSLFVAALAFGDPALEAEAKVGILAASMVSALSGALLLLRAGRHTEAALVNDR
jgi:NhaA family Na+:H+ antiporter